MKGELAGRALAVLSFIVVAGAWEASCRLGWVSPVLLSPPSRIVATAARLWSDHLVSGDLASTLAAFGLSLSLALLLGAAAGIGMGMSSSLYHLLHPYMVSLNSVPKIALMPIVVIWFGLGLPPKVFLGTLMGAFPIAMAAYGGMRSMERDTLLVARSFGAGKLMILRTIVLPGLLPHILSALRLAVNYVLVGVLTVEFFASDKGLGYKMVLYSSNFQTEAFFSVLFMVAAVALLCSAALHFAETKLVYWRGEDWE